MGAPGKLSPPEYSPSAIARHPAPRREFYFTGQDYAAACMRVHDRRIRHDKDYGFKPASTSRMADTAAASAQLGEGA